MALSAYPWGMRPVKSGSAGYNTQGFNTYKIASAYATAMFTGDVVKLVANGVVEKDTGTTALTPIGVFVGCRYTDPTTKQLITSPYWPASLAAADAVALVVDDPDAVFEIQADEAVPQTAVGANAPIVQTAGAAWPGVSKNALDGGSVATTSTLPLRIVGFGRRPEDTIGDAYTCVLVKFNNHQLRTLAGI